MLVPHGNGASTGSSGARSQAIVVVRDRQIRDRLTPDYGHFAVRECGSVRPRLWQTARGGTEDRHALPTASPNSVVVVNRTRFAVPKMDCAAEERLVRMALDGQQTVRRIDADLSARTVDVYHEGSSES